LQIKLNKNNLITYLFNVLIMILLLFSIQLYIILIIRKNSSITLILEIFLIILIIYIHLGNNIFSFYHLPSNLDIDLDL
jgi:hypothetical protein